MERQFRMLVALCGLLCASVLSFQLRSIGSARSSVSTQLRMKLMDNMDALLFDCDGVIAETERDAHRVTFNEAFKWKGLDTVWDVDLYGELLKTGGGKERMTKHFDTVGWPSNVAEADRKAFVAELHAYKTKQFSGLVESGAVPLRPGVQRLIDDAFANDLKVAVCSTSNVDAVTTIVKTLLGEERLAKIPIFAGDMVKAKKPAPDVYLLAATTLGLDPSRCWVVEDSNIGLRAAKAAGMKCVVTKSVYTEDEDFEGADACIKDLDNGLDGQVTVTYLNYKASPRAYKAASTTANTDMFAASTDVGGMMKKIASGDAKPGGFPF